MKIFYPKEKELINNVVKNFEDSLKSNILVLVKKNCHLIKIILWDYVKVEKDDIY